jgi:hypothetical protein
LQQEFKIHQVQFIDINCTVSARLNSSCTSPTVNGLSDHEAQLLTVNNINTKNNLLPLKQKTKRIHNEIIAQVQHLLDYEGQEAVLKKNI